jgi:hypothetical protein
MAVAVTEPTVASGTLATACEGATTETAKQVAMAMKKAMESVATLFIIDKLMFGVKKGVVE